VYVGWTQRKLNAPLRIDNVLCREPTTPTSFVVGTSSSSIRWLGLVAATLSCMADDKQSAVSPKTAAGGRRTPMVAAETADVPADDMKLAATEQQTTAGSRRRRRCRRKRKAGEHHQLPPAAAAGGRHQWKPYSKMTWEERERADERITLRANRVRERRFKSGLAMAPYNTTQFLMAQHEPAGCSDPFLDLDVAHHACPGRSSGSVTGESSVADVDDAGAEVMFMEKEFAEEYENFRAERLQALTKDELVRDYVDLERRLEKMQQSRVEPDESAVEAERLRKENARLSAENDSLRTELAKLRTLRKTSDE